MALYIRTSQKIYYTSMSPDMAIYMHVYNDGVKHCKTVHRLVALAFIPNPLNKSHVNHKDKNKLNNAVSNLEWTTISENILHSYRSGERKRNIGHNYGMTGKMHSKITKQLMSEKKIGKNHPKYKGTWVTPIGRFDTATEAAKAEGIEPIYISRWVKSKSIHVISLYLRKWRLRCQISLSLVLRNSRIFLYLYFFWFGVLLHLLLLNFSLYL